MPLRIHDTFKWIYLRFTLDIIYPVSFDNYNFSEQLIILTFLPLLTLPFCCFVFKVIIVEIALKRNSSPRALCYRFGTEKKRIFLNHQFILTNDFCLLIRWNPVRFPFQNVSKHLFSWVSNIDFFSTLKMIP